MRCSFPARILSRILKTRTFDHPLGLIEAKDKRRDLALPRERFDHGPVKAKVIRPPVDPGMKEPNRCSRLHMNRCHVRAFISVAKDAAERKVFQTRETPVFTAYDVIDLVGKTGPGFRIQTVLTTKLGPERDGLP